jgi:hypothetical protein
MIKHVNAKLMFSIYNEHKEGKIFVSINMSRNRKALYKNKNISGEPVLGDVSRCPLSEVECLKSIHSKSSNV